MTTDRDIVELNFKEKNYFLYINKYVKCMGKKDNEYNIQASLE